MLFNSCALVVIVDNSPATLDSDFEPSRLATQIESIECLALNLSDFNEDCEVGVITASPPENGIRISLSNDIKRIRSSCRNIIRGRQPIKICQAIKRACLALKYREKERMAQKILLFVASNFDLTESDIAESKKLLIENKVILDIVLLDAPGIDVENLHKLNNFQDPEAIFLHVKVGAPAKVFDYIAASSIMMTRTKFPKKDAEMKRKDPELYEALEKSKLDKALPDIVTSNKLTNIMNVSQPKKSTRKSSKTTNKKKTTKKKKK